MVMPTSKAGTTHVATHRTEAAEESSGTHPLEDALAKGYVGEQEPDDDQYTVEAVTKEQ